MVNQNERLLQLGFRTAAELKHKIIYAVDWMDRVGSRAISQVFDCQGVNNQNCTI